MAEENKPTETKQEMEKTIEEKKVEERKIVESKTQADKKKIAIVNANSLGISTKDSTDICSMIRGKDVETAIKMLEEVLQYKRVVKMNKREVPHKKGKGVMAGRYPMNASKEFIRLLKQLNSNALANEIETQGLVIFCKYFHRKRRIFMLEVVYIFINII